MSEFDVRNVGVARSRGIAVAASLALSAVLLAALFMTRPSAGNAAETAFSPFRPALSELTSDDPVIADPARASVNEHAAFVTDCPTCPVLTSRVLQVPRGGTIAGTLTQAGVSGSDAASAVAAMSAVYNPRSIRAGQDVTVYIETPVLHRASMSEEAVSPRLAGFSFRPGVDRSITIARTYNGQYRAREMVAEFERQLVRANGSITSSLYMAALDAGATDRIVVELAGILAYAVDFQRSIQPGDTFDVVFERFVNDSGETVRTGDIVYAVYAGRGAPLEYFLYDPGDGPGYYNRNGESAERLLMMTPINGARLSSHYGMRRHPIAGYNRMHRGTDFAAPTGTPIYAAGNGVVERADRFGTYGNYIRIRHANGYSTAYAHLNGFASGVRAGTRVRQGQTIGYVGSTGASTGPHLHYEVYQNGNSMNPMSLDLPTGRTLEPGELPAFQSERDRILAMRDAAPAAGDAPRGEALVASAGPAPALRGGDGAQ